MSTFDTFAYSRKLADAYQDKNPNSVKAPRDGAKLDRIGRGSPIRAVPEPHRAEALRKAFVAIFKKLKTHDSETLFNAFCVARGFDKGLSKKETRMILDVVSGVCEQYEGADESEEEDEKPAKKKKAKAPAKPAKKTSKPTKPTKKASRVEEDDEDEDEAPSKKSKKAKKAKKSDLSDW